jgi:hypothetical protein
VAIASTEVLMGRVSLQYKQVAHLSADNQPKLFKIDALTHEMRGLEALEVRRPQRPGLENINTGLASTLDGITAGVAEVLGDLGKRLVDFLNRLTARDEEAPTSEAERKDAYAAAAQQLEAKPLQVGQEVEGEVIDVAKVDGENYYAIEQDGDRLAVPAGDKPQHEKGDEITAERTKAGFETGEAYGR